MKKWFALVVFILISNLANAQQLYFPPNTGTAWDSISPQQLGYCQDKIDSLFHYLDINNTKAFILLKDGKIVLEKYFGTHTMSTPWQWASAGKTITGFLVGIAQQENFLSINDTTSIHLGQGWTSCTALQEGKIKIRNQLCMTSGLDDGVPDNFCTLDTCLIYKADAGTRWAYHNAPYTLLDTVIESATGQTLNNYTTTKLKNPTGMTGLFVDVGFNKTYYSNARSMARFGLLILNKGNWNGNVILSDTSYFNQMTNTSQLLNRAYGYLWWLNGKSSFMIPTSQTVFPGPLFPNAPTDMISAMGKGGQFLNIVPSQNLVWLRMGDEPGNSLVPFLLNDSIWRYVNDLTCFPAAYNHVALNDYTIYPNPVQDQIKVSSKQFMKQIEIINLYGQVLYSSLVESYTTLVSVQTLNPGIYFMRIYDEKGHSFLKKWVKQ